MHMRQLFLVSSYFHSNMAADHVVVTSGLKVGDAFDIFEEVQTKIKEMENIINNRAALQKIRFPAHVS